MQLPPTAEDKSTGICPGPHGRLFQRLTTVMLVAYLALGMMDQPAYAQPGNPSDAATASKSSTGRVSWTQSKILGSPEKPLALGIEPAFPKLKFADPMHVRWQADVGRYFVCELGAKIWSFPHDEQVEQADLVVDFKKELRTFDPERTAGVQECYSIVFDPDFATNRFIYACLLFRSKTSTPLPDGSRISRFVLTKEDKPRIDVESELPIITWLGGGHNGCDLAFDNQGCLLISTGDATEPSPPDRLATGQDISDLLASILRIDVRGATREQPYKIPDDNPFREMKNARPEVWAFGFRNPWRIAVDRPTGQLWLGDVGWEKWELVHHVVRGGNYGWSVREGNELLQPNAPQGPGPILPTRVTISHADAASITGGFVYRGKRLSTIAGQYLFGDWITGRIWSVPLDDDSPHVEVASGQLRIIAFAPDRDGEPLVVNHFNGTTLFRLVANAEYDKELAAMQKFPKRLSETGLYLDVATEKLAPGVRPFRINQPQWQDGATSQHFIGLTSSEPVRFYKDPRPVGAIAMFNSRLHYPAGTVLGKTLTLPAFKPSPFGSQPQLGRKIETQILHFDGRLWRGYSYLWNAEQTDAELVKAEGAEIAMPERDGQRWRVHSRTECMQCHNPWPETTLAFTPEQLYRSHDAASSELVALQQSGYLRTLDAQEREIDPKLCVRKELANELFDASLEERVRSYLHANCSHCHQNGAGAAVDVSLTIRDQGEALKAIDRVPQKGGFGILDSKVIATGDATRSALVYRIASSSIGRMPHIGSREVDFAGLVNVAKWIDGKEARTEIDALDQFAERLVENCQRAAQGNQDSSAEAKSRSERLREALRLAIELARASSERGEPLTPRREAWIRQLATSSDPIISSLFEAHIAPRLRQRRLAPDATYADVADVVGNAERGKQFFFDTTRSQCAKCHKVGAVGGQVGPALNDIGKKYSPAQLFESLADPSRVIDPKFQTHNVVTHDGKVISGLLVSQSDQEVVLVNAQGEQVRLATSEIDSRKLDTKSIMPAGLVSEMTAMQMADLLAYLASLR